MALRLSMHFRLMSQSWTEAWITGAYMTLGNAANAACSSLAIARLALCGGGVVLRRATMSLETRPGTVITTGDSLPVVLAGAPEGVAVETPVEQIVPGLVDGGAADIPNTCLVINCSDTTGRSHKQVFMAGIPDSVVVSTTPNPKLVAAAGWLNRYKEWRDTILAGSWGWWGRKLTGDGADPQQVVAVQQQSAAPNLWAVGTTNSGVLYAQGDRVQLRGFRHRPCTMCPWQGQWIIDHVVEVTGPPAIRYYYLRNSEALDPANIVRYGTIEKVVYEVISTSKFFITKEGTRKRGVGWNPPRGKSKRRRRCGTC